MSMSTNITPDHGDPVPGPPEFKLKHRLQVVMEDADLGAADLAAALGVHKNTVYNYLSGSRRPSQSAIRVWALRCGKPQLWKWIQTGSYTPEDDGPTSTTWYRTERHLKLLA